MVPVLTLEQKRAVLVRLGWHQDNARRLSERDANDQLNNLHASRPEAVEFEALRQVGRAWDSVEIPDLPIA